MDARQSGNIRLSDVGIRLRGNKFQFELHPHPRGKALERAKRRICASAFELADVCLVNARDIRQLLLCQMVFLAPFNDARTICSSGSRASHGVANAGSRLFFSIASFRLSIVSGSTFHRFVSSSRAAGSSSSPANARYGLSAHEKTVACFACASSCFFAASAGMIVPAPATQPPGHAMPSSR